MVPYADYLFITELAHAVHAIVFWHVWEDGTYIPLMLPVDEETWRMVVQ
jgi:hypothetical protein